VPADTLVDNMVARVTGRFDPVRVLLFGSRARGDARADSDVDLLVVLPEVDDARRAAIEIRRALADFPVAKDVIVTTPEEIARRGDVVGSILRPALREGIVVYERATETNAKAAVEQATSVYDSVSRDFEQRGHVLDSPGE